MAVGDDQPLHLLAFDHRGSFEKGLFGASEPVSAEVTAGMVDANQLIFEAYQATVERGLETYVHSTA
jgi:hypothetical protein